MGRSEKKSSWRKVKSQTEENEFIIIVLFNIVYYVCVHLLIEREKRWFFSHLH